MATVFQPREDFQIAPPPIASKAAASAANVDVRDVACGQPERILGALRQRKMPA